MRERDARGVKRLAWKHEQRRELAHEAEIAEPHERFVAVRVELVADDRKARVREVRADLMLASGHERAAHERVGGRAVLDDHARDRFDAARRGRGGGPAEHAHVRELGGIARLGEAQRDVERGRLVPRWMTVHDREVLLRDLRLGREGLLEEDRRRAIARDDEAARGLAIEAMADLQVGLVGEAIVEHAGERVEVELRGGVDREVGGLGDDVAARVGVNHGERARAWRFAPRGPADHVVIGFGHDGRGLERGLGGRRGRRSDARELRGDDLLDARAGEADDLRLDEVIEAHACELGRNDQMTLDDLRRAVRVQVRGQAPINRRVRARRQRERIDDGLDEIVGVVVGGVVGVGVGVGVGGATRRPARRRHPQPRCRTSSSAFGSTCDRCPLRAPRARCCRCFGEASAGCSRARTTRPSAPLHP